MLKLDKHGEKVWTKIHGNYAGGVNQFSGIPVGDRAYVIDECWGMMPTKSDKGVHDGYAIACGTGIEGCNADSPPGCAKDPRITWRSLVIATDLEGDRVWSR